jgi:hypothetical protein
VSSTTVGGGASASSLEAALAKKKSLEREIHTLEKQIFALETSYLENTAQIGDLVRGWGDIATALNAVSNSASSSSVSGSALTNMKKRKVMDSERIFSSSSVTARELILQQQQQQQQQQVYFDDTADDSTDFLMAGTRPTKIPKTVGNSSSKKRGGPGRKKSVPASSVVGSVQPPLVTQAMEPLFVQTEPAEISDI